MKLSADETIEKHYKQCGCCMSNILILYELKWSCIPCSYNVLKGKKMNLLEINERNELYP